MIQSIGFANRKKIAINLQQKPSETISSQKARK